MKKRRIGTALVGVSMILGMFSSSAFAEYNSQPPAGATPSPSVTNPTPPPNIPTTTDPGAFNEDLNQTKVSTDTANDNGKINANQTGVGVGGQTNNREQVIKSDGMTKNDGTSANQRTHGEYQNNTNSCASCHQVHTAAAKSLLFKDGVYNTCTACHDGTLGFYNVFGTGAEASTAGTFGGTTGTDPSTGGGNMSVHLATGALQIKAAPGGNTNITAANDKAQGSSWTGEFNCASCHSPHGSYSDRLLNYNPNGMGNVSSANGGKKVAFDKIYGINGINSLPAVPTTGLTSTSPKYIAVEGLKSDFTDSTKATQYRADIAGSTDTNFTTSAKTIVVFELVGAGTSTSPYSYQVTKNAPWLASKNYGTPYEGYWTRFYDSTIASTQSGKSYAEADKAHYIDAYDTGVHFVWADGYAWSTDTTLDTAVTADIAQAYSVKFDEVKIADWGGVPIYAVNEAALHAGPIDENGTIKAKQTSDPTFFASWTKADTNSPTGYDGSNLGVTLNKFCAACHTDYFAKSGSLSGTFDPTSYRHTTNSDSYTCVRCHFAHGTDVTVMKDSLGDDLASLTSTSNKTGKQWIDADAKAFLIDKNPSSALKRYTNMSVCWACHTESKNTELVNNSFYQNGGAGQPTPEGLDDNETYSEIHPGTTPAVSLQPGQGITPNGVVK